MKKQGNLKKENNERSFEKFIKENVHYFVSSNSFENITMQDGNLYAYALVKIITENISYNDLINEKTVNDSEVLDYIKENLSSELFSKLQLIKDAFKEESIEITNTDFVKDINLFSNSFGNGYLSEFFTPNSICNLALKILNIQDSDLVCDMCAGIGNFTNLGIKLNKGIYYGFELNRRMYSRNKFINYINGFKSNLTLGNVLDLIDEFSKKELKNKKFNKIFSHHPLGLRANNSTALNYKLIDESSKNDSRVFNYDWIFIKYAINNLSKDGKFVCVLTDGSLSNTSEKKIRENLIREGKIEAVIGLPEKLLYGTNIKINLVVFSHNNKSVKIINARKKCVESRRQNDLSDANIDEIINAMNKDENIKKTVDVNTLAENDYSLVVEKYFNEISKLEYGKEFKNAILSITRGSSINAKDLDQIFSKEKTNIRYLNVSYLIDGFISSELPYLTEIDKKQEKYLMKENSIILSRFGTPFKIAKSTKFDGEEILLAGNIIQIEINTEVADVDYLLALFNSALGFKLLDNISVGTSIPTLGVDALQSLEIPLPPMEEQVKIGLEYRKMCDYKKECIDNLKKLSITTSDFLDKVFKI